MSSDLFPSVSLEAVLDEERTEIEKVRALRGTAGKTGKRRGPAVPPPAPIVGKADPAEPGWQKEDVSWVSTVGKAHDANLVGLAFSGGGIRSATFNLGVLQALAELKLLHRIDYISTVSGGGYIGGWLAAWTKRLKSFGEVQKRLATNRVHQIDDKEPTPIRFLRVFSNYLTPKLGIFSGDTLAMVAIYLRNLLLNQTIVLAVLTALLLLPRLVEKWALAAEWNPEIGGYWMYAGAALLITAFLIILNNMAYLDCRDDGGARQMTKQGWILALAAAPLFAVAVLGALWQVVRFSQIWGGSHDNRLPYAESTLYCALAYSGIWVTASVVGFVYRRWLAPAVSKIAEKMAELSGHARAQAKAPPATNQEKSAADRFFARLRSTRDFTITLIAAAGAGALAGWLYALLSQLTLCWTVKGALTVGAPLVLGIFLLVGTLHIGLMGIVFRDRAREWWGRLGGWLLLWGVVWMIIFWVALYFPGFISNSAFVKNLAAKYLTPAWILTTVGSVLAGKSGASGIPGTQTWKDAVAKVGPYVFIAGLLCWISYGIAKVQQLNLLSEYPSVSTHRLWWAMLLCIAVAALMAWRVDVNQFSMHLFYRNRLVRCYLGASNEGRSPNRFTGFDGTDDMPLKNLRVDADTPYDGPYPVLNMSLNLVKGKDLAWQERMAESFVMTPRYCGFDVWLEEQDSPMMRQQRPLTKEELAKREAEEKNSALRRWLRPLERYGYRRTEEYAFPPPFNGPNLGLAMGISGAAASPNMGSYSSAPVAFLMTLFDVRLGQWLGNPRSRRTSGRPTPIFGLTYLLNELFAGTDDEAAYVYLSDGGHFENLALYELVKRRCGLIIVCDAEADDCYGFSGLGNAIRKCRIDLGIDVELDLSEVTPTTPGTPSGKHCAVGTIHYENVDVNAPTGTIIYFKASLTGDEPSDVKNYHTGHAQFPHESTAEQWFTESQFESYRELGYHEVMTSMLGEAAAALPTSVTTASGAAEKSATLATAKAIQAAATAMTEAAAKLCEPKISEAGSEAVQAPKKKESLDEALNEQLKIELEKFGFDVSRLPAGVQKPS